MKRALILCLAACGCAASPPPAAGVPASPPPEARTAREGPTLDGQRDLDVLVSFFSGNWDAKPGEPPMRVRVVEFWRGSTVRWLYVEWVALADESRPRRQLVLRVAEDGERMTTTVHRLPGDAMRFAGEWRKPKPFESLRPEALRLVEGCRLLTTRTMIAHFTAVTEGNRCPGDMPQAPYMRFEFSFGSSELSLLEQPRDAAGNVPRSRQEPFQFGRMSQTPR